VKFTLYDERELTNLLKLVTLFEEFIDLLPAEYLRIVECDRDIQKPIPKTYRMGSSRSRAQSWTVFVRAIAPGYVTDSAGEQGF
jgi:hypothetical protein